jgi:hypothetical protein
VLDLVPFLVPGDMQKSPFPLLEVYIIVYLHMELDPNRVDTVLIGQHREELRVNIYPLNRIFWYFREIHERTCVWFFM